MEHESSNQILIPENTTENITVKHGINIRRSLNNRRNIFPLLGTECLAYFQRKFACAVVPNGTASGTCSFSKLNSSLVPTGSYKNT